MAQKTGIGTDACTEGKRSIKNLINIFESKVQPNPPQSPKKEAIVHRKFENTNVTQIFNAFQMNIVPTSTKTITDTIFSKELEKNVSVKSLVYNFQKLVENKSGPVKVETTPSLRRGSVIEDISRNETPLISKSRISVNDSQSPKSQKISEIFEQDVVSINNTVEYQSPFDSEEDDMPQSRTYNFAKAESAYGNATTSEDSDSDSDSYLPKSYLVKDNGEKLEFILPPPPKKGCLKKNSNINQKKIRFGKSSVSHTYGKSQYVRAGDFDIESSSNTYQLEKAIETMERIEVTIIRKPNELLGLSVYGMALNDTNSGNFMAIYVKSIAPNSLCGINGNIKEQDLIVEINDEPLIGVEVSAVQRAIGLSSNKVKFVLARSKGETNDSTS